MRAHTELLSASLLHESLGSYMESVEPVLQRQPANARLRYAASAVAAIALMAFAATRFLYANIIWDPGYYGTYGLTTGHWSDFSVQRVVPGSPAAQAAIKVGDKIEPPQSLHDRLVLARIAPRPGEKITFSILRGDQRRTVTLQARPLAPLPAADRALLAIKFLWLFVFVAVSFVLVLLRPSKMTWGFFLFPFNLTIIFGASDLFFSYIPTNWVIALHIALPFIASAGIIGFLIFATEFPANAPTGWRRTIESLAPFIYVAIAPPTAYWALVNVAIPPTPAVPYTFDVIALAVFAAGTIALTLRYHRADDVERPKVAWVIFGMILGIAAALTALIKQWLEGGPEQHWAAHATLTLGTVALLITYFEARGLERQRIKWVVLGLICAWAADGADHLGLSLSPAHTPKWFPGALEPLYIALPLAVGYAVIKHRVIDVRFVLSRSLAVGAVVAIVALIVVGIDWLFSTRLPNSRLEGAAYVGVALLAGFSLSAARDWIGKTIDFLFFRSWYRTREQAEAIADALRRAASKTELYQPLTAGIAEAFSLASVALFERVEDGGFVRVAARGWPAGTIWHILPDDLLVVRAGQSARTVDIDLIEWHESGLPTGTARPTAMLPIVFGRTVPAMLLCGAHTNGAGLDPDELRAIRRLCADAGALYGRSSAQESWGTPSLDQHRQPLGA